MVVASVFVDVMLPLLLAVGLGAWVGKRTDMPLRPLSGLAFHLFAPALVLSTLMHLDLDGRLLSGIVAVVVLAFFLSAVVAYGLSAVMRADRSTAAAMALCAALPNVGNMGMPLAALAFGAAGLEVAVVVFVTSSLLSYGGGVMIASLATGRLRGALLLEPLRVPSMWAVPPGILISATGLTPPQWVDSTAEILAGAAIPVMLVVLGLHCVQGRLGLGELAPTVTMIGQRLLLGPAAVAAATLAIGIGGVAQQTLILLGGMPTAVIATIIAGHYEARPDLVSRVVVLSTLTSLATLTVLLTVLGPRS